VLLVIFEAKCGFKTRDALRQAKRGQLQHATDRQTDCERNRAKIAEMEASLAELQRRSDGTSTVLQEQTRKWLAAIKDLESTCDTQYVKDKLHWAILTAALDTRACFAPSERCVSLVLFE
jgi:hypothetical protein